MCKIFSNLPRDRYESATRSVRLCGHVTSIRLEAAYWNLLERLAEGQGLSLGRFINELYCEALDLHGEVRNFTSLLRCVCLLHLERQLGEGSAERTLREGPCQTHASLEVQ